MTRKPAVPEIKPNGKIVALTLVVLALVAGRPARGANIVWVSDAPPGGFSDAGSNYTDQGFVTLLQNAGHHIIRYNGPDSQNTLLTGAELSAMNTNDLIIIGRAAGSGAWQAPQGPQWNTNILKPLICMSPYLVRTLATGTRMGWFTGDVGPDDTPVPWTPGNALDPAVDYIFGGVPMNGTNMANLYEVPMDRNTSHMLNAPVAGGVILATATFTQEGAATISTGNAIVGFPAGTAVRGGLDILPAYRMSFCVGTRESATAPNGIPQYTGRYNLTPDGGKVFLRTIELALNSGIAPSTNTGPILIVTQPTNITALPGQPVVFSIGVSGAAARTLQWQRSGDNGATFTNIPGAASAFLKSSYSLSAVGNADNTAQFRVVVSNSFNAVTSAVAVLTVLPDTVAPVPLWASTIDGTNIVVAFDEAVDSATAAEPLYYRMNNGAGPDITSITMRPDGRSVLVLLASTMGASGVLNIDQTADTNGNTSVSGFELPVSNFALTGVDIGAVNPAGSQVPSGSNSFQVIAGGLDMASNDIVHLAYRVVTGDFDAKVRVSAFTGTADHFETTAKAALIAREGTANNSPAVNVFITPSPPGDNTVSATYRPAVAANITTLGISGPNGIPNGWLRIKRVGNAFTTYFGTNGVDWVSLGTATTSLASTLNVGAGAVSHRNGKTVTATFSDLQIGPVINPVLVTNWVFSAGRFSSSFQSANAVTYTVQYKNDLSVSTWTTLTNISGDGSLKTFTDSGTTPTGRRFYRVVAQ